MLRPDIYALPCPIPYSQFPTISINIVLKTATKPITLEAFLELPETKPASEYIDNTIVQKPMPQGKHSKIQWELLKTINNLALPQRSAHAFPELRCTFGGRSIVPDVAVLRWQRIPIDDRGEIANTFPSYPDWTIEIMSPGQSQTVVINKIIHCLEYGCQLGWLIDPGERCVLVFPPGGQLRIFSDDRETLPTPEFLAELTLTSASLFAWLKL